MVENDGEFVRSVDNNFIDEVVRLACEEFDQEPVRAARIAGIASDFIQYFQVSLHPGERMPLDFFDPRRQADHGLFLERTETGLVIKKFRSQLDETGEPVLPESDPSSDY